jgi:hypothetical protein
MFRTHSFPARALGLWAAFAAAPLAAQTSKPFQGVKANQGTVTYLEDGAQRTLTLSTDFVIPDTPAPHWQLVDTSGNAYLLQRLKIKEDKVNQSIVVPDVVADIAKVQIWCSFAETLLGEALFVEAVGGSRSMPHTTTKFVGAKVNQGTVSHVRRGSQSVLTLSKDFVMPDTPAPHWQVVDSCGNVFLLQRLQIKEDRLNRTIVVPDYIGDVVKVQIWCSWAETLLGEASFREAVM